MNTIATQVDTVEGWLAPVEAKLLYNRAKECKGRGAIVEIGSWKGNRRFAWPGVQSTETKQRFTLSIHTPGRPNITRRLGKFGRSTSSSGTSRMRKSIT